MTGAGRLADGRIAVALRSQSGPALLAVDLFGSPPLITLESSDLALAVEPGFSRALDAALRSSVVRRIRARRGDRLIAIDFASRSRFGVGDELQLYLELVPRFGNAVLVKRDTIVSSLKEFSLAENPQRAVTAGMRYHLPPLPAGGGTDAPAEEDLDPSQGPSVLELFAEFRRGRAARGERERSERRRDALGKRLAARERKLHEELEQLERKALRAGERDALRAEGERIFATLHDRAESERDDAKARAAELFARYKKLGASLPHVERRRAAVLAGLETIEALRWECERAGDADLDDVEAAVAQLEPHRRPGRPPAAAKRRKRAPLELRTPDGSRILVGRNPAENAELTFRVARSDDLWFHAQGVPGAHVILTRDDRTPPSDRDLQAAAAVAAFHSKARASAKVPVDYTLRKYVRKRQDAPAGLVWYTRPKTVYARPSDSIGELG